MNNNSWLVVLLVAVYAIAIPLACSQRQESKPEMTTQFANGSIFTVEHDGHKFVIWKNGYSGNMLHHPDCPCNK